MVLREADDARLGDAIGRTVERAGDAAVAADVEDRSPGGDEVVPELFDQEGRGREVDREHPLPILPAHRLEGVLLAEAGVVHEQRDLALGPSRRGQPRHGVELLEVGLDRDRLAAELLCLRHDAIRRLPP